MVLQTQRIRELHRFCEGTKADTVKGKVKGMRECMEEKGMDDFKNIKHAKFVRMPSSIRQIHRKEEKNLYWQQLDVNRAMREEMLGQKAFTLWLTGLSGSGKSTVANALEKRLVAMGKHTMLLDGDNIRMGLNNNLGFSKADRIENIRRVAEVAKLFNDAGIIVITSFISPFQADRHRARQIIGERFMEVYIEASLETCEKRDVKGLYRKARKGEISNFTGITIPYEEPQNPELHIRTDELPLEENVERLIEQLHDYL